MVRSSTSVSLSKMARLSGILPLAPGKINTEEVRRMFDDVLGQSNNNNSKNNNNNDANNSTKPPISVPVKYDVKVYENVDSDADKIQEKTKNPILGASGELRLLGNIPSLKKPKP
uniref:Uncharacterized protein n=1 Tax=Lygus hesperus TaxID=30085 RepID=A0A146M3R6_LYGHE